MYYVCMYSGFMSSQLEPFFFPFLKNRLCSEIMGFGSTPRPAVVRRFEEGEGRCARRHAPFVVNINDAHKERQCRALVQRWVSACLWLRRLRHPGISVCPRRTTDGAIWQQRRRGEEQGELGPMRHSAGTYHGRAGFGLVAQRPFGVRIHRQQDPHLGLQMPLRIFRLIFASSSRLFDVYPHTLGPSRLCTRSIL